MLSALEAAAMEDMKAVQALILHCSNRCADETVTPAMLADDAEGIWALKEIMQARSIGTPAMVQSIRNHIYHELYEILTQISLSAGAYPRAPQQKIAKTLELTKRRIEACLGKPPLTAIMTKAPLETLHAYLHDSPIYFMARVSLSLEWPKQAPSVQVPAFLLKLLMEELARNAGKTYSKKGVEVYAERTVRFRCEVRAANLVFELIDQAGCGPDDIVATLVMQHMAQYMGITLEEDSEADQGMTYRLIVPCVI